MRLKFTLPLDDFNGRKSGRHSRGAGSRRWTIGGNPNMIDEKGIITAEVIENKIFFLRKQKVLLSSDLAELYQVEPRVLIQAVKRNIDRFPGDFMFHWSRKNLPT